MRISDWSSDVCSSDLLHAALGRGDDGNAARRTIDEEADVELARNGATLLDVDALDLLALRTGLLGNEDIAQHGTRMLLHLVLRLAEPHAALPVGIVLETTGAASAGMDLRLNDPDRSRQTVRDVERLVGRVSDTTARYRHAEIPEKILGLVLDRKSDVSGKSVSERVDLGGRLIIKK